MSRCRLLLFAILPALTLMASGCTTFDVDAQYELDDEKLAIVPIHDPSFGGGYFGSPRGQKMARYASETLANEYSADNVVFPEEWMDRFSRMQEKWFKQSWRDQLQSDNVDPGDLTEQEIADKITNADLVMFGNILPETGWQTRDPKSMNFVRGRSILKLRLYDRRGLKLKLIKTFTVKGRYPFDFNNQDGVSSMTMTEDEIEDGLIKVTGRYIAELFYEHDRDIPKGIRFK